MSDHGEEGYVVARVTITRTLLGNDLVDNVTAEDAQGDQMPLVEALGMMRLAEHTLIEVSMQAGEDEEEE